MREKPSVGGLHECPIPLPLALSDITFLVISGQIIWYVTLKTVLNYIILSTCIF